MRLQHGDGSGGATAVTPCRCGHPMAEHDPGFRGACTNPTGPGINPADPPTACSCRGFDVPTEAAPTLLGYEEELRTDPPEQQPHAEQWMPLAAEARADLESLADRIGWTLGTVTMELRPHEDRWLVHVSAPAWRAP